MSLGVPDEEDAFCRIVRLRLGQPQIETIAGALGTAGPRARRSASEHALLASAWSTARPGERASDWLRVVQPIEPPMEQVKPGAALLVLVAGLRRAVAEAADGGDEDAKARLAVAREMFGEPSREQIAELLTGALGQASTA